jgi:hypothetical protein
VPDPLHTARIIFHSPFHFIMIEMGSVGGSSSQNMRAMRDFVPTIASEVSVYMVLDEATSRDRFISHLI